MRTIGIATYTVKIRPKRTEEFEPLGGIGGQYVLADLLWRFLESIARTQAVDETAQLVLQSGRKVRDGETIRGLLHSGEFGYSAEGINVRSRQSSYQRTPDDAEVIPFYYRAFLPHLSDVGLLLMQRFGQHSVYTAFVRRFRSFLEDQLPDHILEINRLVPAEVLRHLLEGELQSIQVVAHSLPTDITDKFRFLGNTRDIGTFVIEAKARRGGFLQTPTWLRRIREGRTRLVELPAELENSDATIRLRVDYQGKARVIDLSDPTSLAPYIDATNDLVLEDSGHPQFESIDAYAATLTAELLQQLGRA